MARTTSALVQGVLQGDYGPLPNGNNPDLTPYIDTASSVVDDVVACAARKGKTLSDAKLELIERWLAAHHYAVMDKPFQSSSTAGASASYNGQTAMGYNATLYGQSAINLDSSGCLRNIDSNQKASMKWLGKPVSEQTLYENRD